MGLKVPLHPCERCGTPTRNAKYCGHPCFHEDDAQRSLEAFWARVAKGPGCWEWHGDRGHERYGRISIRRKKHYAHRIAWELTNGPIPAGMLVMHKCDNTLCVNPEHLQLGTNADNSADMARKGRAPGGSAFGNTGRPRLTETDVMVIRDLYAEGGKVSAIARLFGVDRSTIGMVVHRRTWKDVA